eukprot:Selendium_serpulae@DN5972_c0_g1_i1.p1
MNHLRCVLFLILVTAGALVSSTPPETPVSTLDVAAYLGRWYQTYASFAVKYTFELGGNCVTADYGDTGVPGVVSVRNTVRPLLPLHSKGLDITGFAKQSPNPNEQGSLYVQLGPMATDPNAATYNPPGNYWIIALGPIVEGLYDWAVVSDKGQTQLYVLTRNVERFYAQYNDDVLQMLEEFGFTTILNRPRETNQVDCGYED